MEDEDPTHKRKHSANDDDDDVIRSVKKPKTMTTGPAASDAKSDFNLRYDAMFQEETIRKHTLRLYDRIGLGLVLRDGRFGGSVDARIRAIVQPVWNVTGNGMHVLAARFRKSPHSLSGIDRKSVQAFWKAGGSTVINELDDHGQPPLADASDEFMLYIFECQIEQWDREHVLSIQFGLIIKSLVRLILRASVRSTRTDMFQDPALGPHLLYDHVDLWLEILRTLPNEAFAVPRYVADNLSGVLCKAALRQWETNNELPLPPVIYQWALQRSRWSCIPLSPFFYDEKLLSVSQLVTNMKRLPYYETLCDGRLKLTSTFTRGLCLDHIRSQSQPVEWMADTFVFRVAYAHAIYRQEIKTWILDHCDLSTVLVPVLSDVVIEYLLDPTRQDMLTNHKQLCTCPS